MVVVSRRRDAILRPQFWAEDGVLWYHDAYSEGFRSLLHPVVGYLQCLPRFVALAVQPLPLLWAPLVFNIVAIAIQVLPAVVLLSRRFTRVDLSGRVLLALFYLALPNSQEVHANLTNAQWHLALLACAVVLVEPSRTSAWRIFDMSVLVCAAFTGPFSLGLAPIAVAVWRWRPGNRRLIAVAILSAGAFIQTTVLLTAFRDRSNMALGATPALLIQILSRHVFFGPIEGFRHPLAQFTDENLLVSSAMVVTSLAVIIWAVCVGPLELRGFLAFGSAMFAAALIRPQISLDRPQWDVLVFYDGGRYWLFPMLVYVAALVRLLGARPWPPRIFAAVTLLACSFGIVRDWRMPAYDDFDFSTYARTFSQAPPGQTITIPINPPGWKMQLVKQ